MQLKASIDYGLRAVIYLATKEGICSSKEIAEAMSIPRDYLIQLAQSLRNAGIVYARPGKHGGYRLAKDPAAISLRDVINALEDESRNAAKHEREERFDSAHLDVRVQRAYARAVASYDTFLDGITIGSLLFEELEPPELEPSELGPSELGPSEHGIELIRK